MLTRRKNEEGEEEEDSDDAGGQCKQEYLFSKSVQSYDKETTQNCSPFQCCSIGMKGCDPTHGNTNNVLFNDINQTALFLYGTGEHIAQEILHLLEDLDIPVENMCGQGYDGARNILLEYKH